MLLSARPHGSAAGRPHRNRRVGSRVMRRCSALCAGDGRRDHPRTPARYSRQRCTAANQADAGCGAEYGARSPDRVNQRNGYRHRDFDTRSATSDVGVRKYCARTASSRTGCSDAVTRRDCADGSRRVIDPADGQAGSVAGHLAPPVPGQRDDQTPSREGRGVPDPPVGPGRAVHLRSAEVLVLKELRRLPASEGRYRSFETHRDATICRGREGSRNIRSGAVWSASSWPPGGARSRSLGICENGSPSNRSCSCATRASTRPPINRDRRCSDRRGCPRCVHRRCAPAGITAEPSSGPSGDGAFNSRC